MREYPATKIFDQLSSHNLAPIILFRSSRRQCDEDIQKVAGSNNRILSEDQTGKIKNEIKEIIAKYSLDKELIESSDQFSALVHYGVGSHHAGQLLVWRLLLEELMSRGVIRMLVATSTVAAGVDFPARSVVVTAHSRRDNDGFRVLTSSEFQQMSGRAGRRGRDVVGFCFVAPSAFSDARVIRQISKTPPEPLISAYFSAPSTILNLLKYRTTDELKFTVRKSLASFIDNKNADKIEKDVSKLEQSYLSKKETLSEKESKRQAKNIKNKFNQVKRIRSSQIDLLEFSLNALEELNFLKQGKLTPKGTFAAELCTSLVLELAECLENQVFTGLTSLELAQIIAVISGDTYRTYLSLSTPSKDLLNRIKIMEDSIEKVKKAYYSSFFQTDTGVNVAAASTIESWIQAADWLEFSSLLELGGVSQGDAARLIMQTADNLHQFSRLTKYFPQIADLATEARMLLMRPPISEFN